MSARVERVATSGVAAEGDEDAKIAETAETNTWIVGDDDEVIVVDAGHDAPAILEAVGDREILAVICTHGLGDHVGAAVEVAERDEAPVALHTRERTSWLIVHPDDEPDIEIEDGGIFEVAGVELEVLHTPGHTAGAVCLYCADLEVVFAGDTLLKGGPAADSPASSDFPTLLTSIGEKLFPLPAQTRVCCGHGEETTIADEEPDFDEWITHGRPASARREGAD